MSDPIWYRSLYFRIAFGFVALLATLLAVQGVVFLWMTGRMTELFPSRSPAQVAAAIAADVSVMLGDPTVTDLPGEINRQQQSSFRGFVVALADGRVVESTRVPPPPQLARAARMRALAGGLDRSFEDRIRVRRGDRGDGPGEPWRGLGRGD